ncbi:MAG: hypothetical protein Q7R35_10595 [Elusimicrobiota bacterium]|nr:hypothetical protein [Elusimicrobiota bacterium]
MYKKVCIYSALVLGFICPCAAGEPGTAVSTAAQIQSTISASTAASVFPKLLWEKKLSKSITSSAISKDGSKIAIADETGYLTLYNTKGEKLWGYHYEGKLPKRTYEFKSDKADTAILNITFSSGGKFIICDLGVLNAWRKYPQGGEENIALHVRNKKMCFNSEGKLLWQTSKEGTHLIGGDRYVLVVVWPEGDEESSEYSVFNIEGKLLYKGSTAGQDSSYGFSEDGKYFFIEKKLIETRSGRIIWELSKGVFVGIGKEHVLRTEWREELGRYTCRMYDITTQKKLLDMNEFGELLSDNYAFGRESTMGATTITAYKLKTNGVAWTDRYDVGDFSSRYVLSYLTKDEKYLFVGGEKGLRLYDIGGKEMWRLPVRNKVEWYQYFRYPVAENGEYVLFGHNRSVRLYKSF